MRFDAASIACVCVCVCIVVSWIYVLADSLLVFVVCVEDGQSPTAQCKTMLRVAQNTKYIIQFYVLGAQSAKYSDVVVSCCILSLKARCLHVVIQANENTPFSNYF